MPPTSDPVRLDALLVARGLARSRSHAAEVIKSGRARVDGKTVTKTATAVSPETPVDVTPAPSDGDVSRAARKLRGALDDFAIRPAGLRCVDVGSSTGGFTQVLLERGAREVVAIDVGTDQLADHLRADQRVVSMEGTHVGHLEPGAVAPGGLVVADLSFISLRHVIGRLAALTQPGGVLLPMVKPQFEVGRGALDKHGVVTDPRRHRDAVLGVIAAASAHGFGPIGIQRSRLPGPSGNVEFFVKLTRDGDADPAALWANLAPTLSS